MIVRGRPFGRLLASLTVVAAVLTSVVTLVAGTADAAPRGVSMVSVAPTWHAGAYSNDAGFDVVWRSPSVSALPGANVGGAIAVPLGSGPITDPLAFVADPGYRSSYAICTTAVSYQSSCSLYGSGSTRLLPETTYDVYVFVASTGSGAVSIASGRASTTRDPRPPAPQSVTAVAVADGTAVEVTWAAGWKPSNVADPTFTVEVTRLSDVSRSSPWTCEAAASRRRCRLGGLPADGSYRVIVTAVSPFGSNSAAAITVPLVPMAPTGVSVSASRTRSASAIDYVIDATWPLSVSEGSVPVISYSATLTSAADPDGPVLASCEAAPGLRSCRMAGLAPSTDYVVTVTASNVVASSTVRSEVVTTPAVVLPAAPTSIRYTQTPRVVRPPSIDISPSIELSWAVSANRASLRSVKYLAVAVPFGTSLSTDASAMVSYIISGEMYSLSSYAICTANGGGATASCKLQGSGSRRLLPSTTYTVVVVATDGPGLAAMSDPISVSTLPQVIRAR